MNETLKRQKENTPPKVCSSFELQTFGDPINC